MHAGQVRRHVYGTGQHNMHTGQVKRHKYERCSSIRMDRENTSYIRAYICDRLHMHRGQGLHHTYRTCYIS